jgi:two-component system, chemotaxis family, CheB/CheR fusion protein
MNSPEANLEFEALLNYIKHNQGYDLTPYKRSILTQRFQRRMQILNIDSYQCYLQQLQHYPKECLALLNDVLINVTSFFRDRNDWNYIASEVIPRIIINKDSNEPIRVWSAGCAAGQEIYSLLILLAEALGVEFCLQRVQCYATDADEAALQRARRGIYSHLEVKDIPADLLNKYFQQTKQGYVFHPELRRTIVFGHHDLVKDAPMSKIDLLLCRNVLIYFNPEAQVSILTRFHFALQKAGFIFLGRAERMQHDRQIFIPVSLKHRVYTKGLALNLADHLSITSQPYQKQSADPVAAQNYFYRTTFETSSVAQLAVGSKGYLISANEQANHLFGLTPGDRDRSFGELVPGKLLGSYAAIAMFNSHSRSVTLNNVKWITSPSPKHFDIAIAPVLNDNKELLGITVSFFDVSDYGQLVTKLENTNAELERVSAILQVTRTELETTRQKIQILNQDTSS